MFFGISLKLSLKLPTTFSVVPWISGDGYLTDILSEDKITTKSCKNMR